MDSGRTKEPYAISKTEEQAGCYRHDRFLTREEEKFESLFCQTLKCLSIHFFWLIQKGFSQKTTPYSLFSPAFFLLFSQLKVCSIELFRLKYEEKWVHMYELAKASLNNRGNEIRSCKRRSNEMKENHPGTNNMKILIVKNMLKMCCNYESFDRKSLGVNLSG